jgi:hypothetical protein
VDLRPVKVFSEDELDWADPASLDRQLTIKSPGPPTDLRASSSPTNGSDRVGEWAEGLYGTGHLALPYGVPQADS